MKKLHDLAVLARSPQTKEEWLVEGVLAVYNKAIIVGPQKAGKSILAQQLAHTVATGKPFLGFPTMAHTPILYIAGEGGEREMAKRGVAMGRALPIADEAVWLWTIPEYPFNSPAGMNALMGVASTVKERTGRFPVLTIIDPLYATFRGSLKDDEAAGAYTHALNVYQDTVEGAAVIFHHDHRPRRTEKGDILDEGPESYFGSFVWGAWCEVMLQLKVRPDKTRVLSAGPIRRPIALGDEPLELTLVEPDPLLFVLKEEGVTPLAALVREALRAGSATRADLVVRTGKSERGVREAVNFWGEKIRVEKAPAGKEGRPEEVLVWVGPPPG